MKILSCHIENFGKLHDCTMEFEAGVNRVCEENGWGKSTWAAFVRAMFYGLEGERKRSLEENERKRYKPWQGGVFGGQIVVEIRGKKYQVSRIFGDKEAKDEFELRDADTNLVSGDYSKKIGEEIFQINRESFMRSVFIGQSQCGTSPTDDINAKIGNLSDNTSDMNNFETAHARLAKMISQLTPRRVSGSLARRRDKIAEYERLVRGGQDIAGSMAEYQRYRQEEEERHKALKKQLGENAEKQDRVSMLQAGLAKKSEWERLKRNVARKKDEEEKRRQGFPGDVPEPVVVKERLEECKELERLEERCRTYQMTSEEKSEFAMLSANFEEGVPSGTEIEEKIGEATLLRELERTSAASGKMHTPRLARPFMAMGGMAMAAAGVAVAAAVTPWAWIMAAVGLMMLLAVGLSGRRRAEKNRFIDETEGLRQSLSSFLGRYGGISQGAYSEELYILKDMAGRYEALRDKVRQLQGAEGRYDAIRDSLHSFLGNFGLVPKQDLSGQFLEIWEQADHYRHARKEWEEAERECVRFGKENDISVLEEICADESLPGLEELSLETRCLTNELEASHNTIMEYNKTLENLRDRYDEWEEDKHRLQELKERQAEEEKKYKYVQMAQTKLELAKEAMTARYADPIFQSFGKYYKMITEEDAGKFHVDANTSITVGEGGRQREVAVLSTGYRDLVGLCLRAALVDAMYQGESPFLIMDDPFSNLDDKKAAAGRTFLDKLAEQYQVIYFTCSRIRA